MAGYITPIHIPRSFQQCFGGSVGPETFARGSGAREMGPGGEGEEGGEERSKVLRNRLPSQKQLASNLDCDSIARSG